MSVRRVLLPGLTLPPDDYADLVALLPGETVVLDTLRVPVTGRTSELRAGIVVPGPPYELVGHSVGGLAAIEWAAQYPHEVSRIVLLDPADPFGAPVPAALGGRLGRVLLRMVATIARSPRRARALGRWGRRTVLRQYGVVDDPLASGRVDELFATRETLVAVAGQVAGVPGQVARVRALLESGRAVPGVCVISSADGSPTDRESTAGLATRLGVSARSTPGGHLFPMTHPAATAATMADC